MGEGLTQESAAEMGLVPGTAVAASLIDAHAGGLGELLWQHGLAQTYRQMKEMMT